VRFGRGFHSTASYRRHPDAILFCGHDVLTTQPMLDAGGGRSPQLRIDSEVLFGGTVVAQPPEGDLGGAALGLRSD
jgi:hypothetical protein